MKPLIATQQPMPLEEVAINIRGAIKDMETMGATACMSNDGPERLLSLLKSTLHHLERQKWEEQMR